MTAARLFACSALAIGLLMMSAVIQPSLRLVYNASDSAPRGFYLVRPAARFVVGDYVVARLPAGAAQFAARRGYLPAAVPVLKQVAASAGQRVCVRKGEVRVNGVAIARALPADSRGRPLEVWAQCRELVAGELLLVNPANPRSFDSRYFGPIDVSFVRGRATFLTSLP